MSLPWITDPKNRSGERGQAALSARGHWRKLRGLQKRSHRRHGGCCYSVSALCRE